MLLQNTMQNLLVVSENPNFISDQQLNFNIIWHAVHILP